jgi:phage tail P2-like protein
MSRTLLPSSESIEHKNFDIAVRKSIKANDYLLDFDPLTCNEKMLPYLAQVWQVPFWDENLMLSEKRNLILESKEIHRHIGTKLAIKKALRIIGVEGEVQEWFENIENPYGMQKIEPYGFRVIASVEKLLVSKSSVVLDEQTQNRLIDFINFFKNERSHFNLHLKAQYGQEVSAVSNFSVTEIVSANVGQNSTVVDRVNTFSQVSNFSVTQLLQQSVGQKSTKKNNYSCIAEVSNFSILNISKVNIGSKSKQEVHNEMAIVGNVNLLVIGGHSDV